ncbi:Transmembrane protease serine 13 [Vanrija pseudolonga]|uniref:Transmembrane protease serine 13 n=1 Tax=Vanrija pseudolonga TaxID=143232 RepID=A0AAF1BGM8_9TREE|nr:Transmembrane protease serine 13 [Vanrija pseudolonga]
MSSLLGPVPLPTRPSRITHTVGEQHVVRVSLPYMREDMLFVGASVGERSRRRTVAYAQAQHVILKKHIEDVFQAVHAIVTACKDPRNQHLRIIKAAREDKFVGRLLESLIHTVSDLVQVHLLVSELDVASCAPAVSCPTSPGKRKRETEATKHESPAAKRQPPASRLPTPIKARPVAKKSESPAPPSAEVTDLAQRDCAFLALMARWTHVAMQVKDLLPIVKAIKDRPFPDLVSDLKAALEDLDDALSPFDRYNTDGETGFKLVRKGGQVGAFSAAKVEPVKGSPAKVSPTKVTPVKANPVKVIAGKVTAPKVIPPKAPSFKAPPSKVPPSKVSPDRVSSAKASPIKVSPPKPIPGKVRADKASSVKVMPSKIDPNEAAPAEVIPANDDPVKDNPGKAEPAKVSPAEDSPAKVDLPVVISVKVGLSEIDAVEVGPAEVDTAKASSAKIDTAEVDLNEVDPTGVSSVEVDPVEAVPAEVDTAEVSPAAVGPAAAT